MNWILLSQPPLSSDPDTPKNLDRAPVPTVVVIEICLLYSQRRLYSSQNIWAFYVMYFALGMAEVFYVLSSGA